LAPPFFFWTCKFDDVTQWVDLALVDIGIHVNWWMFCCFTSKKM